MNYNKLRATQAVPLEVLEQMDGKAQLQYLVDKLAGDLAYQMVAKGHCKVTRDEDLATQHVRISAEVFVAKPDELPKGESYYIPEVKPTMVKKVK